MRGIKIFTEDSYDGKRISKMEDNIQNKIDLWKSQNPSFYIVSNAVALTDNELIISVVYEDAPPFEPLR